MQLFKCMRNLTNPWYSTQLLEGVTIVLKPHCGASSAILQNPQIKT